MIEETLTPTEENKPFATRTGRTITLIRHCQSMANVDKKNHAYEADHRITLSEEGFDQAVWLGKAMAEEYKGSNENIQVLVSPMVRTKQTLSTVQKALIASLPKDPRPRLSFHLHTVPEIREHEWANGAPQHIDSIEANPACMKKYGEPYFRHPGGESGWDVWSRVRTWLPYFADFVLNHSEKDNIWIVSHGQVLAQLSYLLQQWNRIPLPDPLGHWGNHLDNGEREIISIKQSWEKPNLTEEKRLQFQFEKRIPHPSTVKSSQ